MLKTEKKLLLWIEKHMFLLMALLAAVISLYLKRLAIWWGSPEINYYFDGHENNIQSTFYFLLVRTVQYLPLLPLHSLKWIAGIADYAVAALCFLAVDGHREGLKLKSTFYFVVCVLSPVVYLRGVCWGQADSLAFFFLLASGLLWNKGKKIPALLLALPGIALYPCMILPVLGYLLYRRELRWKNCVYVLGLALACCLLLGASGAFLGYGLKDALASGIRWASYDPYTGLAYKEPLLWIKQMINLFGYSGVMISSIAAYRHKISYVTALLINLAVLLVYGSIMFPVA